jgi:ComF family protein
VRVRWQVPVGWLAEGWTSLAAAVLPVECAGCGTPDVALCGSCRAPLTGSGQAMAPPPAPGCPTVAAVTGYAGPARAVLVAWKDHGRHDAAPVLAVALAAAVEAAAVGARRPVLLVPVPSARRAVRRRGEDVVASLARRAAAELRARGDDAAVAAVLRQRRRMRDQAGLSADERARNLAGAFALPWPSMVAGRSCVVVDDVVTTGSTLAEAARVLGSGGARVHGAAVVAATARRGFGGPGPGPDPPGPWVSGSLGVV